MHSRERGPWAYLGPVVPVLYIVGIIGLVLMYSVHKYDLLNVCRRPPQVGRELMGRFTTSLWLALGGQVAFQIVIDYFLRGARSIFEAGTQAVTMPETSGDFYLRAHVVFLGLWAAFPFVERVVRNRLSCIFCVCCCRPAPNREPPTFGAIPHPVKYICPVVEEVPSVENDPRYGDVTAARETEVEGLTDKEIAEIDAIVAQTSNTFRSPRLSPVASFRDYAQSPMASARELTMHDTGYSFGEEVARRLAQSKAGARGGRGARRLTVPDNSLRV